MSLNNNGLPEFKYGIYLIQENNFKITNLMLKSKPEYNAIIYNDSSFSIRTFNNLLRTDPYIVIFSGVQDLKFQRIMQTFDSGIYIILLNSNFSINDFKEFNNKSEQYKAIDLNKFIIENKLNNF